MSTIKYKIRKNKTIKNKIIKNKMIKNKTIKNKKGGNIITRIKDRIKRTFKMYTEEENKKINNAINELINYLKKNRLNINSKEFDNLYDAFKHNRKYFRMNNRIDGKEDNIIFIESIDIFMRQMKKKYDKDEYIYNAIINNIENMKKKKELIIFRGDFRSKNGYSQRFLIWLFLVIADTVDIAIKSR